MAASRFVWTGDRMGIIVHMFYMVNGILSSFGRLMAGPLTGSWRKEETPVMDSTMVGAFN
jgi:hypothetical protein